MEDHINHPTIVQKVAGQLHLRSSISNIRSRNNGLYNPSLYQGCFTIGTCLNGSLEKSITQVYSGSCNVPMMPSVSPVYAHAPAEKGFASFAIDFLMGGVSAAVSKIAAAPIERVKLLIQNQDEMIKTGRLSEPYKGITDCFARTMKDEGVVSLWRGNTVMKKQFHAPDWP